MSYTLRLLTEASRDLVVEALRAEADKRTRVAQGAALALAEDRAARKDVRSGSVRVTDLLAQAGRLDQLATELAAAADVPIVTGPVPGMRELTTNPDNAVTLTELEEHVVEATAAGDVDDLDAALTDELGDDGLSAAAHAAMRLAEDYEAELVDPEAPDVETGATLEDDASTDDDRATLDKALG